MKKLKLILAVVVLGLTVPAVASAQGKGHQDKGQVRVSGAAIHCEKQRFALKDVDEESVDRRVRGRTKSSSARP